MHRWNLFQPLLLLIQRENSLHPIMLKLAIHAVPSPIILVFLSSTSINCIVCSEVINISVIYHLEISIRRISANLFSGAVTPSETFI